MKSLNYLLVLSLVLGMLTSSCKKGDVGPKGDKGDTGDTGTKGAAGTTGATGPKGATGTANVIYSGWLSATNYRDTIVDGSSIKAANLPAPKLTQTILDQGTVMVYFLLGNTVFALPYTSSAGGKANTMSFLPRIGHFIITRFTLDNSNTTPISSSLQYRYVIIPGGVTATAAKQIDIKNFDAVSKYYHITD